MRWTVQVPPRFRSQAFSTSQRFPSRPKLRGLVSCHNRSWDPPFRAFPSRGSRASLEVALLPCSYPPACRSALGFAVHPQFHRRPRFHAVAWIPRGLWTPFPRAEARFPVVLGSAQRDHLVPPASPTSEPSSPRESVAMTPGRPSAVARCSPGFFPFEAFSFHALDPRPAQATRT
mgnify:CR=1 FL=1